MIVISGALVLVALVLLIFGITTTDLDFVYASIVVSLVSFGFLLIGILQRRGDRGAETSTTATPAPAAQEPEPAESEDEQESATPVPPRVRKRAGGSARVQEPVEDPPTEEIFLADDELEEELAGGTVLVVPGRPRYHVEGCRYLTGKSATEVEVVDAREEGFTPCGVCKPDDVLATQEEVVEEEPVEELDEDELVDEEPEPEPEPVAAAAPARRTRATAAPRKAPTKRSPRPARAGSSRTSPSPAAEAAAAEPTSDAVLETVAAEAPATSTDSAAASSDGAAPAAGSSRRTGNVVIIPDRGKFHRAECRYVRNAEGTSTLSRTAATRQGYDACGVCKP